MMYKKCEDTQVLINNFVRQSIQDRLTLKKIFRQDIEHCKQHTKVETVFNVQDRNCCISLVDGYKKFGQIDNQPKRICEFCRYISKGIKIPSPKPCTIGLSSSFSEEPVFGGIQTPSCMDTSPNYNVQEYRTLCCHQCSHEMTHDMCASQLIRQSTDSFIINSFPNLCKHICRKLSLQKHDRLLSPYDVVNDFRVDFFPEFFRGLSCRTNRTLNLFYVDIDEHLVFLDRVYKERNVNSKLPAVIIVDKQVRKIYL